MEEKDKKKKQDATPAKITIQVGKDKTATLDIEALSNGDEDTTKPTTRTTNKKAKPTATSAAEAAMVRFVKEQEDLERIAHPYRQLAAQFEPITTQLERMGIDGAEERIRRAAGIIDPFGSVMPSMALAKFAQQVKEEAGIIDNLTSVSAVAHAAMQNANAANIGVFGSAFTNLFSKNDLQSKWLELSSFSSVFDAGLAMYPWWNNDGINNLICHADSVHRIVLSASGDNIPKSILGSIPDEVITGASLLPRLEIKAVNLTQSANIPFADSNINLTNPRYEDYYFESSIASPPDQGALELESPPRLREAIRARLAVLLKPDIRRQLIIGVIGSLIASFITDYIPLLFINTKSSSPPTQSERTEVARNIVAITGEYIRDEKIKLSQKNNALFRCNRSLWLRIKPSHLSDPLCLLRKGQLVSFESCSGNWLRVSYFSVREGTYVVGWAEANNLRMVQQTELDHFARQLNK